MGGVVAVVGVVQREAMRYSQPTRDRETRCHHPDSTAMAPARELSTQAPAIAALPRLGNEPPWRSVRTTFYHPHWFSKAVGDIFTVMRWYAATYRLKTHLKLLAWNEDDDINGK